MEKPTKVLFVCLGNICRSPTAESVFKKLITEKKLQATFEIDSAGTSANHVGECSDPRTIKHGVKRGYVFDHLARQIRPEDFSVYDYIFPMDQNNFSDLKRLEEKTKSQGADIKAQVILFTKYNDKNPELGVPDPYYGGPQDFENVIDIIEEASSRWLQKLT